MKKIYLLSVLIIFLFIEAKSQLIGIKNIPGDYISLASAINDLNTQGVGAGGLTLNLNQNETAPTGGYIIGSLMLDSGSNKSSIIKPVIINGNGNTIQPFIGSSTSADAVIRIAGADGITFLNLNITENVSNNTIVTQMERGIWACMRNQNDAVKDLIISNCTINLNGTTENNSEYGILVNMVLYSSTVVGVTGSIPIPNLPEGIVENITVKSCTTNNCFNGIYVGGNVATSNEVYVQQVIIGGNSSTDGNTILNYGNSSNGIVSNAIKASFCNQTIINYNLITSSLTGPQGGINAAISSTGTKGYTEINNNDISISYPNVSFSNCYGILLSSDTGTSNIQILYNHLHDFTHLGNGALTMMFLQPTMPGTLTVQHNIIEDIHVMNNMGSIYGIRASGGATCIKNISHNTIKNIEITNVNNLNGTGANIYPIYSQGFAETTIFGNYIENLVVSGTIISTVTGCNIIGIYSDNDNTNVTIDSNRIFSIHSDLLAGYISGISSHDNGCTVSIKRNNLSHLYFSNTGIGYKSFYGMRIFAPNSTCTIFNNFISDLTTAGGNTDNCLAGISFENATQVNFYHNTIFLGVSTPLNTLAPDFEVSGIAIYDNCAQLNSINNIIHVNAIPNGNGIVSAVRSLSTGVSGIYPANISLLSNNNIYHVPSNTNSYLFAQGPLNGPFVNNYNLSNDPNFNSSSSLYKSFAAGRDTATYSENNLVASANNTYIPYYNGNTSNGGQYLPSVTTDYFGNARNNPTDIGALEFNVISPTTSPQVEKNIGIIVYPNPSTGHFTISIKDIKTESNMSIELFDLQGQSVFKESIKPIKGQFNSEINIDNFPSGFYILKLYSDEKLYETRLIEKM